MVTHCTEISVPNLFYIRDYGCTLGDIDCKVNVCTIPCEMADPSLPKTPGLGQSVGILSLGRGKGSLHRCY